MNQTPDSSDIPIIFCKTCNKAPMIAKTFNQHLRGKDGIDIEFECPRCGATHGKAAGSEPGGDLEDR